MPAGVQIGVNSVQMLCRPSGLVGYDGKIRTNLSLDSGDGNRLNIDAKLFPFLRPNEPCFVVLAVFQVNPEDAPLIEAKSKLIIPGA